MGPVARLFANLSTESAWLTPYLLQDQQTNAPFVVIVDMYEVVQLRLPCD